MQDCLYRQRLLSNCVEVFCVVTPPVLLHPHLFFIPCKNRNVPVSSSAKLLPSSKIATINQTLLKEATSNFMDDFFQLLQHYSHQLRALLRHPPPLLPASATRRLHLPSSLFPFDSSTADKKSLSVASHLFISADLPVFLMLTRLKLAFQFPSLKRRTLQDVEQEVLKI